MNEQVLGEKLSLLVDKINEDDVVIDKSGVKMAELIADTMVLNPKQPMLDFGVKKTNEDYVNREVEWYLSQSLNVKDIPGKTPSIWLEVSDVNGKINSNYGYLVYSERNHLQFNNVARELLNNKYSRRGMIIYTRPSIWNEYDTNGMSDFICTNTVQYLIRNNNLDAIVNMRSQDVIYGFLNDFPWQCIVLGDLRSKLNNVNKLEHIGIGNIYWQTGSLHVYENHFKLIKEMVDYYKNNYSQ